MNIGERLKELRKMHGYLLREAAAGANVDIKIYQAYEAGRARTPVDVLLSLSHFYGFYSLDSLLGLKDGPKKQQNKLLSAYVSLSTEKRKIVDYILSLNN